MSINRGTDKENVVHMCNEISVVVVLIVKSCLTLCNPKDFSSPGFFVHGISQAIILEWVAISFFKGTSQPRDPTSPVSPALAGRFFTTKPPEKPAEYYSAIKKNNIMAFAATWMDLVIVILSEVHQTGKEKYMI